MVYTWLQEMIDGGKNGSDAQPGSGNHHPLERIGRKDGDHVSAPAAETQQMTRRNFHLCLEFPERHRFPRRHVHLHPHHVIIIIVITQVISSAPTVTGCPSKKQYPLPYRIIK